MRTIKFIGEAYFRFISQMEESANFMRLIPMPKKWFRFWWKRIWLRSSITAFFPGMVPLFQLLPATNIPVFWEDACLWLPGSVLENRFMGIYAALLSMQKYPDGRIRYRNMCRKEMGGVCDLKIAVI